MTKLHDTARLVSRRDALRTLGVLGSVPLLSCKTDSVTAAATSTPATTCVLIPQETDGPYPLYTVLTNTAMVRSDVREGKTGVPLTLKLTFVNVKQSCNPISNAAVYIWHCDKDGQYSGYSSGPNGNNAGATFLRGIQPTSANGEVTFTTVFPLVCGPHHAHPFRAVPAEQPQRHREGDVADRVPAGGHDGGLQLEPLCRTRAEQLRGELLAGQRVQ